MRRVVIWFCVIVLVCWVAYNPTKAGTAGAGLLNKVGEGVVGLGRAIVTMFENIHIG